MGTHRYGIFLGVLSLLSQKLKHSKQVRYKVEHEKRNSMCSKSHVLIFL